MHAYFPGMVVGIILLQTAIIAPSLVKTLSREQFGVSIRAIWPKFFVVLMFLGLASLAVLLRVEEASVAQYAIAGGTVSASLLCYAIIPATNRATDTGNHARFKRLHQASVGLTVLMLLANIAVVFL